MAPSSSTQTGLQGVRVDDQLAAVSGANANLTAACRGILDTRLAPSGSHWHAPLQADLAALQRIAALWRDEHAGTLHGRVLAAVAQGGRAFLEARDPVNQLFAGAEAAPDRARAGLQDRLSRLQESVRAISGAALAFEEGLKGWGGSLRAAHDELGATIRRIQGEEESLGAQVRALNATIASMQGEIIRDRQAIASARSQREKGILETVFGILLVPITGGLSLILTGIGVSSIAEAEGKVAALEQTIRSYQARIAADQRNMTQDQAQVATLQALTVSAGVALSDADSALKLLDGVRTTWNAFLQELTGVIAKLGHARTAQAIAVERAWWNAACREWELIAAGTQALLGAPRATRVVTCAHCA